jgi:hypothetical protein
VAHENDAFGVVEIFVSAGRTVGAERLHQRGGSRRRAQPRIGVDRRDTKTGSRDLAECVVLLKKQLAAVIDPDSVRPLGGERFVEPLDDQFHRFAQVARTS